MRQCPSNTGSSAYHGQGGQRDTGNNSHRTGTLVAPIALPNGVDIVLSLHDLKAQGAVINTITQRVSLGGTQFPFEPGQRQPKLTSAATPAVARTPSSMLLTRQPVLPIEIITIAKASQETRSHALIVTLDNEQLRHGGHRVTVHDHPFHHVETHA